jgi:hypothetical protein
VSINGSIVWDGAAQIVSLWSANIDRAGVGI